MARDSETRSDALPAKRDEVVAQLMQLADLVQHDRWEDAGHCMDVVKDGFTTCCAAWTKLRMQRNLAKRSAELDEELTAAGLPGGRNAVRNENLRNLMASGRLYIRPHEPGTNGHEEQLEANRVTFVDGSVVTLGQGPALSKEFIRQVAKGLDEMDHEKRRLYGFTADVRRHAP